MSDAHRSSNERVDPRCGCTRSRDPIIGTLHRPDCWADNMVAAQREIDRLTARVAELEKQKDGYRGAVERLNAVLERRQKPERPFGWYRELQATGATLFHRGDWPPPEPDDTEWYPLYSTPEGRPADETTGERGG